MRKLTNQEILDRGLQRKIPLRKDWSLEAKLPPAPKDLSPEAKAIYNDIGESLVSTGFLKVIDGGQLATLALAMVEQDKVEKQLEIEGTVLHIEKTVTSQKGTTVTKTAKKNPLFETYMSLNKLINKMYDKLGMTPLSRNRMRKQGS